jgi:hypothetical protein
MRPTWDSLPLILLLLAGGPHVAGVQKPEQKQK